MTILRSLPSAENKRLKPSLSLAYTGLSFIPDSINLGFTCLKSKDCTVTAEKGRSFFKTWVCERRSVDEPNLVFATELCAVFALDRELMFNYCVFDRKSEPLMGVMVYLVVFDALYRGPEAASILSLY
jgi:hypothetical protein